MWDWHLAPEDTATWTGTFRAGNKTSPGVVQWFEHGLPIDRLEGTYVEGRRLGPGRYRWNETEWKATFPTASVSRTLPGKSSRASGIAVASRKGLASWQSKVVCS
jgi:hypothetical protein